jgi:hypothetical protein
MNLEKHLEELRRKHYELEETISYEQRQAGSPELEIKKLKKKKLHIKDRIREVLLRVY